MMATLELGQFAVGQTVRLLATHPNDGGWSTAYVESVAGSFYGVRVQGHSLYYVTADKLEPAYEYLAARQAYSFGKSYADYIEAHTAELVAKGYDVGGRNLGEALAGNDGD